MKNDVIGQGRNRDKATFSEERMINLLVRRPDMTYQETGDSIGVSKRIVHRIARQAGGVCGAKKKQQAPALPQRYNYGASLRALPTGFTVKDIAGVLPCNQVTIRSRLRAVGITKTDATPGV